MGWFELPCDVLLVSGELQDIIDQISQKGVYNIGDKDYNEKYLGQAIFLTKFEKLKSA